MIFTRLIVLGMFFSVGYSAAMKRTIASTDSSSHKRFKGVSPWHTMLQGTPLHDALRNKNFFEFWGLVESGADVDELDANGYSILWNMTQGYGFSEEEKNQSLSLLIRHDVDLDVKTPSNGITILHAAVSDGNIAMIKKLIQADACVDVQDYFFWTPLHYLGLEERPEIDVIGMAKILIDAQADLTAQTTKGKTPLHHAVSNRDLAKFLLIQGAEIEIDNDASETPYKYSERKGLANPDLKDRDSVKKVIVPAITAQVGNVAQFMNKRQTAGCKIRYCHLALPQ